MYVVTPDHQGRAHEDDGSVTVSGTYQCDGRVSELVVHVTQAFGGGTIRTSMHVTNLRCDGNPHSWRVTDGPFDGSFLPGPATVRATLTDSSNPDDERTLGESTTTVELTRG
jgi:Family of unknown function (DUF6299)